METIDSKTINLTDTIDENCKNLTKDQILQHIQTVINGCCNSLNVSNSLSSWKNTAKGLSTIKQINNDFHIGLNLWVNITMDTIIRCDNETILKSMINDYDWINDLLLIKKYINAYYANQV
uniref:Uncharacterized protein n=1 Tax=viral metagenome TaxID=1070528 RepID=A0A6C0AXH2_9ZZZZ|tara:strand:+ start:2109 stop:2471 length:363 start_codon:yes stop_codon:yes gene_type:complete